MNELFEVHLLNEKAIERAKKLAENFDDCLEDTLNFISLPGASGINGRYVALFKTHMELASFYAKKALAVLPENQKETG